MASHLSMRCRVPGLPFILPASPVVPRCSRHQLLRRHLSQSCLTVLYVSHYFVQKCGDLRVWKMHVLPSLLLFSSFLLKSSHMDGVVPCPLHGILEPMHRIVTAFPSHILCALDFLLYYITHYCIYAPIFAARCLSTSYICKVKMRRWDGASRLLVRSFASQVSFPGQFMMMHPLVRVCSKLKLMARCVLYELR